MVIKAWKLSVEDDACSGRHKTFVTKANSTF